MIKYIYIAFLFFYLSIANSEVVKRIEISGNDRVGDETIKVYGEIELNKNYSNNDVNKILKNLYSTN